MKLSADKKEILKRQDNEYKNALKDSEYATLVKKLKLSDDEVKKNTIKLMDTMEELDHCKNCSSLFECQNKVRGHVFFPTKDESNIVFTYIPCKYQKKESKKIKETNDNILDNARLKDIKPSKNRIEVIKWIKNYYDSFDPYKTQKGLYLHGSFGTGKTFLIAALLNELKDKYHVSTEIVYFPELLRKLKEDLSLVGEKLENFEGTDILLLDDIGAEKVTEWGRDEILGTILQTRMNKGLPTFFTSNLNIKELESHLSLTKDSEDILKAKRILERVKFMSDDIELLGNNYRE